MPPAAAIGGSAAASAIGGIGGAIIQGNATRDAVRMQTEAADRANKMQWDMYQQQRADYEPWRAAGSKAIGDMGNADFQRDFTMSDFNQDPGYAFRMQEGQKALERSAAARGGLQSGGTLRSLARYGQDYASNEYQNAYNRFNADRDRRFNRLSSIAGAGQTASNQLLNAGSNYANQIGQNAMGAANAQGAAALANGQMWGNTLSSLGQIPMQATWMNQFMNNQSNNIPNAGSTGSGSYGSYGSPNQGTLTGYNYNQSPESFWNLGGQ